MAKASSTPSICDEVSDSASHIHLLPSGRQLGYAEFGVSKGRPVFYFHGFPASRYEALDMEQMAQEKNIRLICTDRPGAGSSTIRPRNPSSTESNCTIQQLTLMECAEDVLSLADHLNLDTFSILGYSAGGPLALACAACPSFPPERLRSIGVVAGAGPWLVRDPSPPTVHSGEVNDDDTLQRVVAESDLRQGILWREYLICFGVWHAPTITKFLITTLVAIARFVLWIGGIFGTGEAKKESQSSPILAAFDQGAEGVIHIARQWLSDWGFRISDIKGGDRIQLWHGTEDVNVPILQARYVAQRIPGVRYKEERFKDVKADHMGIRRYMGEILDEIVKETKQQGR